MDPPGPVPLATRNLLSGPSAQSQGLGRALRVTPCEGRVGPPHDAPACSQEHMLSCKTEIGGLTLRTRKRQRKEKWGVQGRGGAGMKQREAGGEEECASDMRKRVRWRLGRQGTVREPGSDT